MRSTEVRRTVRGWLASLVGVLMVAPIAVSVVVSPAASATASPCGPGGNPVACENSKPGNDPAEWDVAGAGDPGVQGFATQMSVNIGEQVDFKVDSAGRPFTVTIYRTGWYGGLGARKITTVENVDAQGQPECLSDTSTGLYDCGTWGVSASWQVPTDAVSGVYVAKLRRPDNGDASHITFVVRDDASTSDVLFQTSDATWQAYNTYGGGSFYSGAANGRASKVSYNRPFATRGASQGRDFYFASEYAMARFLERNGYDVSYTTDVDSDRRGELIKNHRVFLSVGHDEYWSGAQRANMEAARDAGVNLGFFTGNEGYWRTRWESSSADGAAQRTLVSYKETFENAKVDPSTEWTGTWRDPRFASQEAGGGLPENELTGTAYVSNDSDLPVTVSAEEGRYRLWRDTSLASMGPGTSAALAPHTVGYESNEDLDNGFRPEGLIRLSTTTGAVPQYLQDFGTKVAPGTTTHSTTMYRASSGSLVFSTGSIQWSWGLDQTHDGDGAPADPRMQQATVNVLADMSALPATLMAGLVQATRSTDTVGPTVAVTTPVPGQAVSNGATVTATGTASDAAGRVAAIEVSSDGGQNWRRASGTSSWSYTFVQTGEGTTPLMVRAVDDSANIGTAARVDVQVSCPCSIFGSSTPETPSTTDVGAVELGLRFSATIDGYATGVRFFKGTGNTGTHTGSLWSVDGQQLSSVTFTNESAGGWQEALFDQPVPLAAGTTYVVSYTAPNGGYAVASDAFWYRGLSAPPLTTAGGFGAAPAGVFADPGRFPTSNFGSTHYFVDVLFSTVDLLPLTASGQTPLPGATSVPADTAISVVFSKPVADESVRLTVTAPDGSAVAGATTYTAGTRTATFTPAAPLAATTTFGVRTEAADLNGTTLADGATWTFTTAQPDRTEGVCPCSLFNDSSVPSVLQAADSSAVTLGVQFASSKDGTVTGVRFYKGPGNVGPHTGALWSADGTPLASATFTAESSQGWQTVTFDAPVAIAKDTEYVVSYRTPVGKYSMTPGGLSGGITRGPLRVAPNGATYSYEDAYPGNASSTNYLVDLVFEPAPEPLTVLSQTPEPGSVGVSPDASVSASFSKPLVDGVTVSVRIGPDPVAGTTTLSPDRSTVTFSPAQPLPNSTAVTVDVTGAAAAGGTSADPVTWSFSTADANGCPCTLFGGLVPESQAVKDGSAIELGVSFMPATAGEVTGVRFYKGPGNTGTHTGSLWTSAGTRLATITFTGESGAGWQTGLFDQPVEVEAGSTYVVSYFAPDGGYAATRSFFSGPHVAGQLTAPAAGNGRYSYGGGFPTSSYQATNYFVDVVFRPVVASAPTVVASAPPAGTTGVSATAGVSATLSKSPAGTPAITLAGPGGAIAGESTYDAGRRTVLFRPSGPLPLGAEIAVTTSVDGVTLGGGSWTFATETVAPGPGTTLFGNSVPARESVSDPAAIELGVSFAPTTSGAVTGVRFYKGPSNTGTHTGSLWSTGGELLATATFANESAAGWQTVLFDQPVRVDAGSTYVASYLAPEGGYSATPSYFSGAQQVSGELTAPASGNGRYRYGGGFPTSTWQGTNYFADVVFTADEPTRATVVRTSPPAGTTGVSVTARISATLDKAPTGEPVLSISGPSGPVPGLSSYEATTRRVVFTPSGDLPYDTELSASASVDGVPLAGGAWAFRTAAAPSSDGSCPCTIFEDADRPETEAWNDPAAVQVGVRFAPAADGAVSGIRFYKGLANTGVHTVTLWSAGGQLLASAEARAESAAGWQTVAFDQPVAVTAGTVYTAAYHSTAGRYAITAGGLSAPLTRGPLGTPANAGAYVYGTGYPAASTGTNFWVDPVYRDGS